MKTKIRRLKMVKKSYFDEMKAALKAGKIVALQKTVGGGVVFGGAFNSDNDAALTYSAASPEGMKYVPEAVFVKGIYELSPSGNL